MWHTYLRRKLIECDNGNADYLTPSNSFSLHPQLSLWAASPLDSGRPYHELLAVPWPGLHPHCQNALPRSPSRRDYHFVERLFQTNKPFVTNEGNQLTVGINDCVSRSFPFRFGQQFNYYQITLDRPIHGLPT
jgi:hypothetical protein